MSMLAMTSRQPRKWWLLSSHLAEWLESAWQWVVRNVLQSQHQWSGNESVLLTTLNTVTTVCKCGERKEIGCGKFLSWSNFCQASSSPLFHLNKINVNMTKCHLVRGLLECFLYKGFGEEVTYNIYVFRARVGATKTLTQPRSNRSKIEHFFERYSV